jgi:hypothetical protein
LSPKPSRPTRAEREEMARLLPVPAERDLPGSRHQLLKGLLMHEIQQKTAAPQQPRIPRRRLAFVAVPLVAGAMAAALAAGGVLGGHSITDHAPAAASGPSARGTGATPATVLLERIATVAASKPMPAIRDNQYIYIASQVAFSQSSKDPSARLEKLHLRQTWQSVDGSRPGLLRENGGFLGKRIGPGGLTLERNLTPTLNLPTYRYLQALPTDPGTLLKKIYDETKGHGTGPDPEAFQTIGDLLGEQLAPPEVSAALYRAAARIPGVSVVSDAVDAVGRHGIGVARVDGGRRFEWIFDRHTMEFLGERDIMVASTPWATSGEVIGTTAILTRSVTDKPGQTPGRAG